MVNLYHGTTVEYHDSRIYEVGSYSHKQRNIVLKFLFGEMKNDENRHLEDIYFTGSPSYAIHRAILASSEHKPTAAVWTATPAVLIADSDVLPKIGKIFPSCLDIMKPLEHEHIRLIRGILPLGSYRLASLKSIENAERLIECVTTTKEGSGIANIDDGKLEQLLLGSVSKNETPFVRRPLCEFRVSTRWSDHFP